MADRTTRVILAAEVSSYLANMEKAAASTRAVGTAAEKLAAQRQSFDLLGRSMVAVGAVAAATVALAVAKFAQFDEAMSSVKAATQESASNMTLLRDAAIEAGGATVFSATEAAGAIENLAKAGVSTADILGGGLNGALSLAAAGQLAVGDAAEIAASALTQFNLKGSEVPHVADLLAAGAGKAQGEVADLGAALNQSGLVASQMGLSLEETTGSLAAFASAGLIGSDAGTSFRQMLLRLANPTEESKNLMDDLGLAAYDASGNFVGMEAIAGQLKGTLEGKTQAERDSALATIFGSDAIRAANVLYKQGAEGIAEWTAKVDASGYAAQVAHDRLDNLNGDLEKLGGAFDTALIQTGSAANDVLRDLVQTLTFVVDAVGGLPEPVLGTGLAIGGLVAAVGLVGGGVLLAIPRIAEFKNALETLNISARKAAIGAGIAGAAFAAATFIIGAQISVMAESAGRVDAFAGSLDQATGKITDYTRELAVTRLEQSGAYDAAQKMGIGMDLVTEAALGNAGAMKELKEKTNDWYNEQGALERFLNGNAFAYDTLRQSVKGTSDELADSQDQWSTTSQAMQAVSNEAKVAASVEAEHQAALEGMSGAAEDANDEISGLADTIRGFGSATLDAQGAEIEFQEAIDAATDAVEENGQTLDKTTDAGRANRRALIDLAKSALDSSAATLTQTGSLEKSRAKVEEGREAFIRAATQMGKTKKEAQDLADKYGLIPSNVKTAVSATGFGTAQSAIDNFIRLNNGRVINISVNTGQGGVLAPRVSENGNLFDHGNVVAFANGGFAPGVYSDANGPLYQFAEPGTNWEAYISGKRGQEARNREIWAEAGNRLGMTGGGPKQVINVSLTNHNPVAQSESESIRQAGQYIGALVSGGF